MLYKLKDRFRRTRFAGQCKAVLDTPPAALDPASNLALLSQLQHKDVLMFLLAVKSFAREVRPAAVFVLNDGSLTPEDLAVLAQHIPDVAMLALEPFRNPACPAGGCWERLLAISRLVEDFYVIQLDSDTLTVGPIAEVAACVQEGKAFALGTWDRQRSERMDERVATARKLHTGPSDHVQLVAEANFDKLSGFASLRYVRGCAGFGGFPRRSFSHEFVEAISREMRMAIGDKWDEWGSEQVMSNIVLANVPGCMVLPHPKYADCQKMRDGETVFIHFIGSCRFDRGLYASLGRRVIAALTQRRSTEALHEAAPIVPGP